MPDQVRLKVMGEGSKSGLVVAGELVLDRAKGELTIRINSPRMDARIRSREEPLAE